MRIERESAPAAREAALVVEVMRGGREVLRGLAPEWSRLCDEGPCDEPFYRPEWIGAYLEGFEPDARLAVAIARRDGALRGVLPLVEERTLFFGLPARRLRGAANVHSCRFDLVHGAGDRGEVVQALLGKLAADGGWDVLEVRDVPEGGALEELRRAAEAAGHPTGAWESMRTPYVPLPGKGGSIEEVLGGLDGKFKANLRRRWRKLEQQGEVTFRRVDVADPATLEAFYALEAAGWKGRRGSAIACDARTRAFYDLAAAAMAARGALSLYVLAVAGEPVAIHWGLSWRGRYFLPKPAYDEAHRACSPGQLLLWKVLEDCVARGLTELDFLGPWMEWKADWTERVRPHAFQYVFRKGPWGRALRAAKFELAPRARERWAKEGARMEAVLEKAAQAKAAVGGKGTFAPALPSLAPSMLVPRTRRAGAPFPFSEPGLSTFYFARNGIHALAKAVFGLSGKEVLFPAYFHGVELEALLEAGVRPRFYPVRERMRVDPAEVEARISPETRAIYLIHYAGFPGPVEELRRICDERRLLLLEDCALALLSRIGDRPLGTWGDASIFCVYKTIPAPNGGCVVLRGDAPVAMPRGRKPPLASTAAHAASSMLQGLEARGGAVGRALRRAIRAAGNAASRASKAERVSTGTQHFVRDQVGLAMSDLSRIVVDNQDFDGIVERRRRNYFHLLGRLRDLHPPVFGELPPGVCPLFFPHPVKDKQVVLRKLHARGVEAIDFWRVGHPAVPPGAFPEVDALRQTILEIPCHQDLTPKDVDRVATIVREVVKEGK